MIEPFRYEPQPARVLFGEGRLDELGEAVASLGGERALILSTKEQAGTATELAGRLGDRAAGTFSRAVMHTPVEVTDEALAYLSERHADCLVAIGGGSSIGLGKALALRTDLPQVAIPTTYAGSEMTDILGETRGGEKTTQRSRKILPEVVIYDVELTLSLPPRLSATSGMNAIAHAVEALCARDGNPIIGLMAEDGIRAFGASLPGIIDRPDDLALRSKAQYGAFLCGACLGAVSMALHHKLCHVLGGTFDLPHAETHAIVLPHAVAYNAPAAPQAMARVARALRTTDAAGGLFDLATRLGVPKGLKSIGMPPGGIDRAVTLAVKNPYWNPRPLEADALRRLIANAYEGSAPGT
ncbi:MAG: maleylacetate reductase [Methylobacteriaceae bacterium]|nr:maleylacetate reductase [Methylobacteriaceae bacterium]